MISREHRSQIAWALAVFVPIIVPLAGGCAWVVSEISANKRDLALLRYEFEEFKSNREKTLADGAAQNINIIQQVARLQATWDEIKGDIDQQRQRR